jgi:hypothetical protein
MEQIECSETSANINQTPGKHPKDSTTGILHNCLVSLLRRTGKFYSVVSLLVMSHRWILVHTIAEGSEESYCMMACSVSVNYTVKLHRTLALWVVCLKVHAAEHVELCLV